MDTKCHVFLSHASANFPIMKEMADYLESIGYICWYAPRNIAKGNNYLVDIVDAIDKVDVVLLLHSKEVHDSKYVYREIEYADQMNKLILPILIDDAPIAKQLVLIIRSMQMTSLFDYPSVQLAVDSLHERMESYQIEREQAGVATDWLKTFGTPLINGHTSTSSATAFIMKGHRLEQLRRAYVPVENFDKIHTALGHTHLAVLQDDKRSGKFSTAINLLLDKDVEQVIEVLPTLSMVDFLTMPFKHHAGYIIDKASLSFFDMATNTVWEELQEKLQLVGSYLVITTEDTHLPEWVITHSHKGPSNKRSILIQHASAQGIDDLPEAILDRIDPYLEKLQPFEIAMLPDKLLPVLNGSIDLETMISQLQSQVEERVNHWYHEHGHSLSLVSQYVTLTILKEVPEKTFMEASTLMAQHLQPLWIQGNEQAFLTDGERLNILHAERLTKKTNTDIGYMPVDYIQLSNKDEADIILTLFWEQLRFARPALLSWFDEYIAKAKKSEYTVLHEALTVIAKDLQTVRQELLQKWAMHDNIFYRLTVVKVLTKLITSNQYVQEIINLLKSWSAQRNNLALQWTATVALGSEIGIFLYPNTFTYLQKSYLSNPKALRHPAKQSFTNLLKLGSLNVDYEEAFYQQFGDWLLAEQEMREEPFEFLHFFFSIIRSDVQSLVHTQTADQIQKHLTPFLIEALKYSKTKRLGEEFLTMAATEQPKKIAPLVLTLLYHENRSVGERTKNWLKIRMSTQNRQPFTELYEEMMEEQKRKLLNQN